MSRPQASEMEDSRGTLCRNRPPPPTRPPKTSRPARRRAWGSPPATAPPRPRQRTCAAIDQLLDRPLEVVFASEMAQKTPWHVVNLVSSTQARRRSENKRTSYADPTDEVRGYLHSDWRHCFTFRTWEELHAAVISGDRDLAHLDRYLRDKSAHFEQAFALGY